MKLTARNISIIVLALVALAILPGCGLLVAEIDTDAAIAEAVSINVENIRAIVEMKSTEHLDTASDLDASLIEKLRASSGGAEAVEITEAYRKTLARNQAYDRLEMSQYKKALGNAILMKDLFMQRLALRAKWTGLVDRVPALRTIRATAEAAARRYVETIGQPGPADIIRDPDQ